MDTPVPPKGGRFAQLYGEHGRRINAVFTAFVMTAATTAIFTTPSAAQKGHPPITQTTKNSGGRLTAERAALRLERVELDLSIDAARKYLSGTATLHLKTSAPQTRLLIDLDQNFTVSSITIDGAAISARDWRNPDGQLIIALPKRIEAGGEVTAVITYAGTPHEAVNAPWDDGIVWSEYQGKPWVATTAQGYGCDLFWPCLDFPAGEIGVIRMSITTDGEAAVANGRHISTEELPNGKRRWTWEARNINPYLVAINIGPFRELRGSYASRYGNQIPLHFWYRSDKRQEAEGLFAEFAPTLDFFERVIGPFPFSDEKLGVVETPHLGMEHQTINAYGNNFAKDATGFDWLFHHELAHEWFGNQMTVADWDDFWLHEGYAQYMQPLYGQWRDGEARYAAMMAKQRELILNHNPLVSGQSRTSEDVYKTENNGPGQDIYYKGSWVLHTLRYLIGDKAFFDGTRRLVYGRPDPHPGNFRTRFTSTAEFEAIMNDAAGRDLSWFFNAYLRHAKLPNLVQQRVGDRIKFMWQTTHSDPFPMPIDVAVNGNVQRLEMRDGEEVIAVPADAHIVVDPMARVLRHDAAITAMQSQPKR